MVLFDTLDNDRIINRSEISVNSIELVARVFTNLMLENKTFSSKQKFTLTRKLLCFYLHGRFFCFYYQKV